MRSSTTISAARILDEALGRGLLDKETLAGLAGIESVDDFEIDGPNIRLLHEEATPGCPACGGGEVEATVTATANVVVTFDREDPHVDNLEWQEATNVEIDEATSFTCRSCGHYQSVDNDIELYRALNLAPYAEGDA